mmetsp:Transcript_126504/g.232949  ORF Transcript_126504/g.232949 Transcript_126504/m.232949 type:complete len:871 (+) Transcript_126504:168-2780(+)
MVISNGQDPGGMGDGQNNDRVKYLEVELARAEQKVSELAAVLEWSRSSGAITPGSCAVEGVASTGSAGSSAYNPESQRGQSASGPAGRRTPRRGDSHRGVRESGLSLGRLSGASRSNILSNLAPRNSERNNSPDKGRRGSTRAVEASPGTGGVGHAGSSTGGEVSGRSPSRDRRSRSPTSPNAGGRREVQRESSRDPGGTNRSPSRSGKSRPSASPAPPATERNRPESPRRFGKSPSTPFMASRPMSRSSVSRAADHAVPSRPVRGSASRSKFGGPAASPGAQTRPPPSPPVSQPAFDLGDTGGTARDEALLDVQAICHERVVPRQRLLSSSGPPSSSQEAHISRQSSSQEAHISRQHSLVPTPPYASDHASATPASAGSSVSAVSGVSTVSQSALLPPEQLSNWRIRQQAGRSTPLSSKRATSGGTSSARASASVPAGHSSGAASARGANSVVVPQPRTPQDYQEEIDVELVLDDDSQDGKHTARRLREAQLAALRLAEAQIAARKRFDAEMAARAQAANGDGAYYEDEMPLDDVAVPGGATAVPMPFGMPMPGSKGIASDAALEAKFHESMLRHTQEAERWQREVEWQREAGDYEHGCLSPPREGAAWEAACVEARRVAAETVGRPPSEQDLRHGPLDPLGWAAQPGDAASLASIDHGQVKTPTLGRRRQEAQNQERFAAAVQLQMAAQEAMRKRVEMSETARRQAPAVLRSLSDGRIDGSSALNSPEFHDGDLLPEGYLPSGRLHGSSTPSLMPGPLLSQMGGSLDACTNGNPKIGGSEKDNFDPWEGPATHHHEVVRSSSLPGTLATAARDQDLRGLTNGASYTNGRAHHDPEVYAYDDTFLPDEDRVEVRTSNPGHGRAGKTGPS